MKRLCYELEQIELYDNYRCIIITYTNVIIGKRSEIDFDVEDKNYIVLHKDAKYGADTEHILCEFIVHREFDEGDEVDIMQQTGPEEFEFFTQFHNGGTCLEEVLSEELSKSEKVAPIK